jgi:hypothetical protein
MKKMKKKRVLRKWVSELLIGVTMLIICVLTGEFASLTTQGIFILFGGLIVYMNAKIIKKWGNLKVGDDDVVL